MMGHPVPGPPMMGPPPGYPPAYAGFAGSPYTGQPVPSPPAPPRGRTGLWVGLSVGVVVMVLAAGLGAYALVRLVARQTAAPDPSAPTTSASARLDLFALMLERPADATESQTSSDDGSLTIDQMAQWWNDPGVGLERLESRGFVTGAQRAWENPDGSLMQITLVQLATDLKANGLARDFMDFYYFGVDNPAADGSLPGVVLGRFVIDSEANSDGQFHASALFTRGTVMAMIDAYHPRVPATEAFVDFSVSQYNRLPTG
jgi:hypothetical protein